MSDSFVTLELKTVVYSSKLPDFQFCESLALEHSESDTDFMDKHYLYKHKYEESSGTFN